MFIVFDETAVRYQWISNEYVPSFCVVSITNGRYLNYMDIVFKSWHLIIYLESLNYHDERNVCYQQKLVNSHTFR